MGYSVAAIVGWTEGGQGGVQESFHELVGIQCRCGAFGAPVRCVSAHPGQATGVRLPGAHPAVMAAVNVRLGDRDGVW